MPFIWKASITRKKCSTPETGIRRCTQKSYMRRQTFRFSKQAVAYYFDAAVKELPAITDVTQTFVITDAHVFEAHQQLLKKYNCIVLHAGEQYKTQQTVDAIIAQLIEMGANRNSILVGVGGGVVTDITGYVASIYMRGIRFGFFPSSLLAMVDASIGGKNGVDTGIYKNMVGTIRQPDFIAFDAQLLRSLPENEWRNGFAEIIKHACIGDAALFRQLEATSFAKYRKNKELLQALIRRNATFKTRVVQGDEFEKGNRKLLNFGHTLGHAIENSYELSHGQAISIGMTYACHFSEQITGFRQAQRVIDLLNAYGLPTHAQFDHKKALAVMQKDKKMQHTVLHYILLERLGKAAVHPLSIDAVAALLQQVS